MPNSNQPPATPASDAQCPKCGAAYADTSFRWMTDEIHRGQSKLYFDVFECGTNVYGTTLGLTQSDPCRIAELTADVARLTAALTAAESQTQHFRTESGAKRAAMELTGHRHCTATPFRPWLDLAMRNFVRRVDHEEAAC